MTKSADRQQYQEILDYISAYFESSTSTVGKNDQKSLRNCIMKLGHIGLPNPVVAANNEYFAGEQFYWDSYFINMGLLILNDTTLAKGMVDNLCWLFKKFGHIPAHNSWRCKWHSQPPLLSRMAWDVFDKVPDDIWMSSVMATAQDEYETVWSSRQRLVPDLGLNKYNSRFFKQLLTVYESGWDVSSRFTDSCSIVPIDLNCLLYQYESDLEKWAIHQGQSRQADVWAHKKFARAQAISHYLWDEKSGFYYDYDHRNHNRRTLKTVAGFMPLWCGAASKAQADKLVQSLPLFETDYGLTSSEPVRFHHRQWDYPNGWPPLHYFVISGLRKYGYSEDADRITKKWLNLNYQIFNTTGALWEKYDVVHGAVGKPGRYPTQSGFGWTNGVFLELLEYASQMDTHKTS
ncbi:MAG: hypothetical protein NVS1B7_8020 [Candidatus Saccharimonadales bacterium]